MSDQLIEDSRHRIKKSQRGTLEFIEDYDAAAYVMQLPATPGPVRKQAAEKFRIGRDYHWGGPIFGG
jgi:hypothetical protein